jgi:alkaline phosphatase D
VHDDYDADSPTPVMADFCAAGISSSSQFSSVANAVKTAVPPDLADVVEPVLKLIVYDASALGGTGKAIPNLNTLIRWGAVSATTAAMTNDLAMAEAARAPAVNEHLRYVDSAANGYGLVTFDGDGAKVTLITIDRPLSDNGEDGVKVRGKADFALPVVEAGGTPALDEPELTGKKPFPLS